jgi:hemoglobin
MTTKKEIETRADIEKFIQSFYEKVMVDPTIGTIFTEKFNIDWKHHIPLITDFWETILLDNPVYTNNAMGVHYNINKVVPLQKLHFDAWLVLFNNTLDEFFVGEKVDLAKKRALGIAQVLLFKMNEQNDK